MSRTIAAASAGSNRNRGVLMLAALFAVLSGGLMFAFLSNRGGSDNNLSSQLNGSEGSETVVVLTRDVTVGEKITSDMLTTRPLPAAALLPGHILKTTDIEGKVATAPMFAGEQALSAKVTTFEGQNTLAYKIPDGMRALSLQVPHEAWVAAGLVQPGDHVDIMGLTTLSKVDPLTGEEKPLVIAGIIAQNVEVLAVAQTLVKTIPNTDAKTNADGTTATAAAGTTPTAANSTGALVVDAGSAKDDAATYEKAISITLALPPDLAAKVAIIDAMKDDAGQYRILPRQKGDDTEVTGTVSWNLDDVFPANGKK